MNNVAPEHSCIYCKSTGPFSGEHVFPAGLGGDNKFQLHTLVCKVCNNKVFGPLDEELMRRSPAAVARQFHMTEGRYQGSGTKPPTLDTKVVSMIDADSKLVCEAEVLPGGGARLRPQVLFHLSNRAVQAASLEDMQALVEKLALTLTNTAHVIVKERSESAASFQVTTFQWDGSRYFQIDTTSGKRPPAIGVWHEVLTIPTNAKPDSLYASRLFLRREGQLVLRALAESDLSVLLTEARRAAIHLQQQPTITHQPTVQQEVHVQMSMDMGLVYRAMAKTGVNHVCQEYGEAIVRLLAFDLVKQAIKTGDPQINVQRMDDPNLEATFTQDPRSVHLAMLWPARQPDGTFNLLFGLRLFGTAFQAVMLAEGVALPLDSAPVIYTVHYQEHRMERSTLGEYLITQIVPKMLDEGRARAGLPASARRGRPRDPG